MLFKAIAHILTFLTTRKNETVDSSYVTAIKGCRVEAFNQKISIILSDFWEYVKFGAIF